MKIQQKIGLLALVIILLLSACNVPKPATQVTPTEPDIAKTFAGQTISAMSTQIVQTNDALGTPTPPVLPTNTEALLPTNTVPVATLMPATATVTSTTALPCDVGGFVSETIPDGTSYNPGQVFTKTWTIKNTGSCTWTTNYAVVFVSGDSMGAPASKQLTTSVAPGGTITITMDLTAPNKAGNFRADFKLRNASGVIFGLGAANGTFWVKIAVKGTTYNFVDNYCSATWYNGTGATLSCPGVQGDANGYAIKLTAPELENGAVDDEPAILVFPNNNGLIKAVFPAMTFTSGVYFKTIVGCRANATNCNVTFKLNAKVDGGAEQTLATWTEKYDKAINRVSYDLSALAGKSVQFILVVESNGDHLDDQALWFMPVIAPK